MDKVGYACSFFGGTIINAISTNCGSAFGIELKTYAKVSLSIQKNKNIKNIIQIKSICYNNKLIRNKKLIEWSLRLILKEYNYFGKAKIETFSEGPIESGLKSSSSVSNAVIIATLKALHKPLDPLKIIKYNVLASKQSNVTITGSFDDACASMYGKLVFTDNKKLKILKMESFYSKVIIFYKDKKQKLKGKDILSIKMISNKIKKIFNMAMIKNKYEYSALLNGVYYCNLLSIDPSPIYIGLKYGFFVNLAGTGPSFIIFIKKNTSKERMYSYLKKLVELYPEGKIIYTKSSNRSSIEETKKSYSSIKRLFCYLEKQN